MKISSNDTKPTWNHCSWWHFHHFRQSEWLFSITVPQRSVWEPDFKLYYNLIFKLTSLAWIIIVLLFSQVGLVPNQVGNPNNFSLSSKFELWGLGTKVRFVKKVSPFFFFTYFQTCGHFIDLEVWVSRAWSVLNVEKTITWFMKWKCTK